MAYNSTASYNLTEAQSRIEDLDYPKAVSEMKKKELLDTFQIMMQKKNMENETDRTTKLFQA
jgi:flagellin